MNTKHVISGAKKSKAAKPDAVKVFEMLKEGNRRFAEDQAIHPRSCLLRRQLAHSSSQADHAVATVLACSDSRVPVERIFDMGFMDLFVVRVAGNVIDRAAAASLEYGMLHVHTPLLLVLGHTDCGAVTAAIHQSRNGQHPDEANICGLLTAISPAVERALKSKSGEISFDELLTKAVEENTWQSLGDLLAASPAIQELVATGAAGVAVGIYHLETGEVGWLNRPSVDPREKLYGAEFIDYDPALPINSTRSELMAEASVLIVDDEVDFLKGISERLKIRDFLVDTATSGLEALDKLELSGYDAIILDLMMPGLDGLETLKQALKKNPDLQIILLTGQASIKKSVEAMRAGALDFIEKPASLDTLAEKIREGRTNRRKLDENQRMQWINDVVITRD